MDAIIVASITVVYIIVGTFIQSRLQARNLKRRTIYRRLRQ